MKTATLLVTTFLSAGLTLGLTPALAGDTRDVVHDARSQVITSTSGSCVRTRWMSDSNECGPVKVAQAAPPAAMIQKSAPPPVVHTQIPDKDRTVYFEFNKTRLMPGEQAKLNSLATTLKAVEDINGVSVVGYADRIGSTSYNERLSMQRAEVVEQYLRQRGYLKTTVAKTRWLGETVPVTQCDEGLKRSALITCLQHDRRVTVEMQYKNTVSR